MSSKLFVMAGVMLGIGLFGCGPASKLASITGTVNVNGQPVEKGSISFIPVDGSTQVTGAEIITGKYNSPIPIGESKVEIRVPKKTGSKKLYDTPDSPIQDTFEELLPVKYNDSTELRFTAVKGSNKNNWDLKIP